MIMQGRIINTNHYKFIPIEVFLNILHNCLLQLLYLIVKHEILYFDNIKLTFQSIPIKNHVFCDNERAFNKYTQLQIEVFLRILRNYLLLLLDLIVTHVAFEFYNLEMTYQIIFINMPCII